MASKKVSFFTLRKDEKNGRPVHIATEKYYETGRCLNDDGTLNTTAADAILAESEEFIFPIWENTTLIFIMLLATLASIVFGVDRLLHHFH